MKYLMVVVVLLGLTAVGCGSKDKRQEIRHGRTDRAGPPDSTAALPPSSDQQPGTGLVGIVIGSPQEAFTQAVRALVSSTLPPDQLGFVSGQANQDTGIVFAGFIELEGGPLSQASGQQRAVVTGQSNLKISIWDSFAGQTYQDERGQTQYIPEYAIGFSSAQSGSVSGRNARITFADQYGSITLVGQFDGDDLCQSVFWGDLEFHNSTHVEGLSPFRGVVGDFYIYAADLFRCP